jgi:hypothetical protein
MRDATAAQLYRAPPSEGGGHTFESCRAPSLFEVVRGSLTYGGSAGAIPVALVLPELAAPHGCADKYAVV